MREGQQPGPGVAADQRVINRVRTGREAARGAPVRSARVASGSFCSG
jgi:hypothetical protein